MAAAAAVHTLMLSCWIGRAGEFATDSGVEGILANTSEG